MEQLILKFILSLIPEITLEPTLSLNENLKTILIISLFCVGLRVISSPGKVFYFLRKKYDIEDERKPKRPIHTILKPVIGCVSCMASVHSIWIFTFLHGLRWELFICAIASAGINAILYAYYESILRSCAAK